MNPRSRWFPREIVPKEYQPTFNSETGKAHKIPGIPEHFIVLDDDMMVGRDAPSVFFTQFGGPILYLENSRVQSNGCPAPSRACGEHQFATRMGCFWIGRFDRWASQSGRRTV